MIEFGVRRKDIMILTNHDGGQLGYMSEYYNVGCFSAYLNKTLQYPSAVRFHILAEFWKCHPEMEKETIFYHDSDIIFTKKIDFSKFLNDNIWYLSDCKHYLGARYIKSKGLEVYNDMCDVVGIDKNIPVINENCTGGAQYILKPGITAQFWEECAELSEKLYVKLLEKKSQYHNIWMRQMMDEGRAVVVDQMFQKKTDWLAGIKRAWDYNPLQIYTADMWTILWKAWKMGIKTETPVELDFAWPHNDISRMQEVSIYHDAGVLPQERNFLFYKGDYTTKTPFNEEDHYDPSFCSHYYFQYLQK
jgi:hypothetical protein